MQLDPPLSLYVHIPWCVRKCPYCDFNSHEKKADFDELAYVDALLNDLEYSQTLCSQQSLHSIFFGGGTPSLFTAASIKKIIDKSAQLFDIDNTEITLEANPGTFEQEKFAAFRASGVNRLSIGIQSFHSGFLQALGRIHNGDQALLAVETARQAGFDNINLDLMYGLPQQTPEQAMHDIKIACQQKVNHLSHYQLTIEPNTYFDKHTPVLPEAETLWEMQDRCQQKLQAEGYQQYEVSAYAQSDKQSRHNLNYWLFGDYIGIGAGAHGKLSDPESGRIRRIWKCRQPRDYMLKMPQQHAISGEKILSEEDIIFDFLLNALRLKHGCKTTVFEQHTGLSLAQLQNACNKIDKTLLNLQPPSIVTSEKGYLFLNDILQQLI